MITGRPRAIPQELWGDIFEMYARGYGYRKISNLLLDRGVGASKSSIAQLIRGLGVYRGRKIPSAKGEAG